MLLLSSATKAQNTIPTTTVIGALSVNDSLKVSNNIHATGDIKALGDINAVGELVAKDTVRAQKDVLVDGNIRVGGDMTVTGVSSLSQLKVSDKIFLPGNISLSAKPNTTTGTTDIIIIPNSSSSATMPPDPDDVDHCNEFPNISSLNYPNGKMTFYGSGAFGTRALTIGFDGTQGFIEASGGGFGANSNRLLMNYYCGKDIYMCTGTSVSPLDVNGRKGGVVSMGPNVEIGMPQRDAQIGLNMNVKSTMQKSLMINSVISGAPIEVLNITSKGGLNIFTQSSTPLDATFGPDYPISIFNRKKNRDIFKISAVGELFMSTENANGPVIRISNADLTKDVFVVSPSGMTQIGVGKPKAGGQAANAMLSVDGLILAKEIKVAIANTHWADYVFEKNYELIPLNRVEQFINENKHLPGVPNEKQVTENGVDVVEMNATLLKKVEELTLYLIEQNKRIEKLESENSKLKSQK